MKLIDADVLKEKSILIADGPIYKEVIPISALKDAREVKIDLNTIKEFLNKRGMEVITKENLRILRRLSGSTYGLYRSCPYCESDIWAQYSADRIICKKCDSIYKRENMLIKESNNEHITPSSDDTM